MCSINWTKSRGHILFYKILSKRSPWALKDEEPCLFYCKDTPNSLGGMRLFGDKIFYDNLATNRIYFVHKQLVTRKFWNEDE